MLTGEIRRGDLLGTGGATWLSLCMTNIAPGKFEKSPLLDTVFVLCSDTGSSCVLSGKAPFLDVFPVEDCLGSSIGPCCGPSLLVVRCRAVSVLESDLEDLVESELLLLFVMSLTNGGRPAPGLNGLGEPPNEDLFELLSATVDIAPPSGKNERRSGMGAETSAARADGFGTSPVRLLTSSMSGISSAAGLAGRGGESFVWDLEGLMADRKGSPVRTR